MRVRELIDLLEQEDDDARVYLADWIDGYDTPGEVTGVEYEDTDYGFFRIDGVVLNAEHCGNAE